MGLASVVRNPLTPRLVAAAVISLHTLGMRQVLGIFNVPIQTSLDWGRAVFSLNVALLMLGWGFSGPFFSIAQEKWGAGKVLFIGGVTFVLGFVCYALAAQLGKDAFPATGLLLGLGSGSAGVAVIMAEVGRYFVVKDPLDGETDEAFAARKKETASRRVVVMSLVSSVGQAGQFIYAPVGRWIIATWGYQTCAWFFAASSVSMIPMAWVLRTRPLYPERKPADTEEGSSSKPIQSQPDTELAKAGAAASQASATTLSDDPKKPAIARSTTVASTTNDGHADTLLATVMGAMTDPAFLLVSAAYCVCGFHIGFIGSQLPAYLQDKGLSASDAAWTISVIGIGSTVGAFVVGFIPRYFPFFTLRRTLAAIYFIRFIAIGLFLLLPITVAGSMIFSFVIGTLWLTTVPLTTGLIANYHGTKYMGTLSAISLVGHQVFAFVGSYMGGVEFDLTGSYAVMWWISCGGGLFAAAMVMLSREEVGARTLAWRRRA